MPKKEKKSFPVVGIGASAGGLDAIEKFFKHMTATSGMTFIVITHLSPSHESLMPDLIRKYTGMKVLQIEDGMRVEKDCVYVTPPNKDVAILKGVLQLIGPSEPGRVRLSIDYFLRSLAHDQGERAIAIILSGTGSDGSLGIKEIKGELGMVMVQDPGSAKYDAMIKNAINTGVVDYILPPDKLPEQLLQYIKYSPVQKTKRLLSVKEGSSDILPKIIVLIRAKTGHDFSFYKKNTILRRVERRMSVQQIDNIEYYLQYLQKNPHEVGILFNEILIGVTSFFRDPEAFNFLKTEILPQIMKDKPNGYSFRVWVPACSSGEEAYSLAIIIWEYLDELRKNIHVQIFGTDIDTRAIDTARYGLYPQSIFHDVPEDRLNRFFMRKEDGYQVKKEIREMIIFAPQNVIKDPPFTKLDIISCRNLLIYLEPEAQKKLISLLHYALKPDGILFLGTSEGIGEFSDLFSLVEKKWKLFKRRESKAANQLVMRFPPPFIPDRIGMKQIGEEIGKPKTSFLQLTEKMLLEEYAPSCVVINDKGEILYVYGRTGKYLELASGEPAANIFDMAREGLKVEISTAIRQAISQKREVFYKGLEVKGDGGMQPINLKVKPIIRPESMQGLFMVLFEDISPPVEREDNSPQPSADGEDKRIEEVEAELRYTKENLQSTIEELETSNEELTSSNEELMSTNEELQSTNEELETSQEELQSLNEEHATLNVELQSKIDDITLANNDMKNLLENTDIAIIFLDNDLRVTRFTSKATEVVNLIPTDLGRPINDFFMKLRYETLTQDVKEVLKTLVSKEMEVQTHNGRWYLLRMKPYRTTEDSIEGVVITLVDIHEINEQKIAIKKHQEINSCLQKARNYAEAIIRTVREPLVVLNKDLQVISCNQSFYKTFQVNPDETEGQFIYSIGSRQWDIPKLREMLNEIITKREIFEDFFMEHEFPVIGYKRMLLNARRILSEKDDSEMVLLAIEDITGLKEKDRPKALYGGQ